jgi:endonuclease YncB( thermonuclease family)
MKFILALIFVLVSAPAFAKNPYDLRVIRVIDGDTVEIDAPFLPVELRQTLRLRIIGVDTPEKGSRAKCRLESDKGYAASRFTEITIAKASKHQVIFSKWDKYGGRVLGDLLLDGKSLKNQLLESGHARPYKGDKKSNWC